MKMKAFLKYKILSLALAIVMALGIIPITANAQDDFNPTDGATVTLAAGEERIFANMVIKNVDTKEISFGVSQDTAFSSPYRWILVPKSEAMLKVSRNMADTSALYYKIKYGETTISSDNVDAVLHFTVSQRNTTIVILKSGTVNVEGRCYFGNEGNFRCFESQNGSTLLTKEEQADTFSLKLAASSYVTSTDYSDILCVGASHMISQFLYTLGDSPEYDSIVPKAEGKWFNLTLSAVPVTLSNGAQIKPATSGGIFSANYGAVGYLDDGSAFIDLKNNMSDYYISGRSNGAIVTLSKKGESINLGQISGVPSDEPSVFYLSYNGKEVSIPAQTPLTAAKDNVTFTLQTVDNGVRMETTDFVFVDYDNDGKVVGVTLGCEHSGGTATCYEKAVCENCKIPYGKLGHDLEYLGQNNIITESCEKNCGHSATAKLEQDAEVTTVYNGAPIEALKVIYSDNWQGGDLALTYTNNTNAGTASGSVEIGDANATLEFQIKALDMTGVSALGYSGTYDGETHGITVVAPHGATITYKTANGEYSDANPTFKDAGVYTVDYKVSLANHNDYIGSAQVKIDKVNLTVTADNKSKIYNEIDPVLTWSIKNGALVKSEQLTGITLSREAGEDVNTYTITASQANGANKNYSITFKGGTFTISRKTVTATVTINGGPFYYTGNPCEPSVTVMDGDAVIPDSEYTVTYENNVQVGEAKVTIGDREGGNYTVNAETTFNINQPLSVVGPSDTQTGDNSNLWLWVALMLVSGTALFGIIMNERKRKVTSNK